MGIGRSGVVWAWGIYYNEAIPMTRNITTGIMKITNIDPNVTSITTGIIVVIIIFVYKLISLLVLSLLVVVVVAGGGGGGGGGGGLSL